MLNFCILKVLTTFRRLLRSITEQTHRKWNIFVLYNNKTSVCTEVKRSTAFNCHSWISRSGYKLLEHRKKHLALIIFQISHCLLQACLPQLNVSKGVEYLADCSSCCFRCKFCKTAPRRPTWTMNSDHARESQHAVTSSVCLYSNR